jgi:hypothetical protein
VFDRIKNVEVYGLINGVVASGYPMTTGEPPTVYEGERIEGYKEHMDRGRRLGMVKSGSGHDSWLKSVVVQFDISMTQVVHRQILRYHFLDIVSSQSLMHRITTGEHEFHSKTPHSAIALAHYLLEQYNNGEIDFEELVYGCPMGVILWTRVTTNYLQLKTVYHQRKSHKLPEWRDLCTWIKSLPHFKELVLGEIE